MPSRWAESAEDVRADAARRAEREERKRAKAEKQRRIEEQHKANAAAATLPNRLNENAHDDERPSKKRRLSHEAASLAEDIAVPIYRFPTTHWQPCRSVSRFERLNDIEDGSYGSVSRAREETTQEIVALKKLKLNRKLERGISVTALREIQILQKARHKHIVQLREVVTGEHEARGDVYLVMEFLEHDLRTLQEEMQEPFLASEVKTLLLQLSSALDYLHHHWIIHRDLKTSNILMNNRGEIKLADFGMARLCGDPPPDDLTQLVVTLWYRAPELLLETKVYNSSIDMWSLGCVFGELLNKKPLVPGKNEVDQLSQIFKLCGVPTDESWPGFRLLPNARSLKLPSSSSNQAASASMIPSRFPSLSDAGTDLLESLLSLDPRGRPTAPQVLRHPYFREDPRPKPTDLFPTFPSKAGQEKRRRPLTPNAPIRGAAPSLRDDLDFSAAFKM